MLGFTQSPTVIVHMPLGEFVVPVPTVNGTASFLVMPVSQRGNSSAGYLFGTSVTNAPTTALDEVASGPQAYLQEVDPQCATTSFLRHGAIRSGSSRVQHWVERAR